MITTIELTRLPGRPNDVVLQESDHKNMLTVIGFAGLKHGDVFGLDAPNREKMRAWLYGQDAQSPFSLEAQATTFARALNNATLPELREARAALAKIAADMSEPASLRTIARDLRASIATR
jgi:hydrogenase/urease accessory protein HupE